MSLATSLSERSLAAETTIGRGARIVPSSRGLAAPSSD
jgi:hypothetical protein